MLQHCAVHGTSRTPDKQPNTSYKELTNRAPEAAFHCASRGASNSKKESAEEAAPCAPPKRVTTLLEEDGVVRVQSSRHVCLLPYFPSHAREAGVALEPEGYMHTLSNQLVRLRTWFLGFALRRNLARTLAGDSALTRMNCIPLSE